MRSSILLATLATLSALPSMALAKSTFNETITPIHLLYPDHSTLDADTADEVEQADLTCNPGGYIQADIRGIKAGIRELDKLDGFRTLQPRHCEIVACAKNAVIWWCNDADENLTVSYRNFADKAKMIINGCPWGVSNYNDVVAGIRHVRGGWKVLVKQEMDRC
ncbi:hypothetical protein BJX64DRAFT_257321 [Aspergillus heterothallicus]